MIIYIHMYKVIYIPGPLVYINQICGCKKMKNENQVFVFYLKNKITKTLGMEEHAKENGSGSNILFSY